MIAPLIDSHVNLHAGAFAEDLPAVVARARAAGVGVMVSICDRMENLPAVLAVTAAHPGIWASVGAHPHHAKDHQDLSGAALITCAREHPRICAIGETGLDQHYGYSPIEDQVRAFRAHIEAARALDLPLIVHTREADALTAEILEEEHGRGAFRILLHCYTSGPELARRALALGAYISFSGILTFKAAHAVREVAQAVPLERVILETDCPYLAPIPHRGRRCEPAFVADVYRHFATLRGLGEDDARALIAENFHRLFHTIPPWEPMA